MSRYLYIDEGRKHLHTLDEKPLIGTSTVAKESVNKGDGLMQWYGDSAALVALGKKLDTKEHSELQAKYTEAQALQDPRQRSMAMKALDKLFPAFDEARHAAIARRDASALVGTERHGSLEDYVNTCLKENGGKPLLSMTYPAEVTAFINWAVQEVEQFYFTEANCYSERLWLGGIADIGLKLKTGQRLLGDHKSSKNAYFDQFIQAALYDIQLSENGGLTGDGTKLFDWGPADGYVVFPFRSTPFTPEFVWDVEAYKKVAEGVVATYKLKQTLEN